MTLPKPVAKMFPVLLLVGVLLILSNQADAGVVSWQVTREGGGKVVERDAPSDLRLHQFESNDTLWVFEEKTDYTIQDDVEVDREFGSYLTWRLPDGMVVDSYLLHYDPHYDQTFQAIIQFENPVVALIGEKKLLVASDAILGCSGTSYERRSGARGIDPNDNLGFRLLDEITVEIFCKITGYMDEMRIITSPYPYGDSNYDGRVDDKDLNLLLSNYGYVGDRTWADGDFTGNGVVTSLDLETVKQNFGSQASPVTDASHSVPEPSALLLCSMGLAALVYVRRRTRTDQ